MKVYYVYILASKRNGTIYIGVTNDVERRSYEHKIEALEGIKLIEKYNPEWVDLTETFLDSRVQPENDKDMV